MEIFLISNNLFENNLSYLDKQDIEKKKMTRPLSIEGEELAKALSLNEFLANINLIYSSMFSSSLASAKYLAQRLNKTVTIDENFNDCKVGILNNKSLKMVKFMQNHDFNIKLNNGESLNEVGDRIDKAIKKLTFLNDSYKLAIFTHKRTMLGFLIKYGKTGYNLDDDLIIEYNDKVVYNEAQKEVDIIKLTFTNRKLVDIDVIDI